MTESSPYGDDESGLVVRAEELNEIIRCLGGIEIFGSDGRCGIDGQLHRISAIFDKTRQRIFGLTLRIGRAFMGSGVLFKDILYAPQWDHVQERVVQNQRKSILLLGAPGSGTFPFFMCYTNLTVP